MKNILFIAYQFPPLNVGGSARPAKFVKYLKDNGIQATIVTLHPDSYENVYSNPKRDSNLLNSGDDNTNILPVQSEDLQVRRKNKVRNFFDIFFNHYRGNEKKFWKYNYHRQVDGYLKKNKVSAIVVTAPPFGVLSLAVETSRRYNLPLIVDMRDPWTMWTIAPYSTYFNFLRSKWAERKVFKHAKKIIATSEVTITDFKQLHRNINPGKFEYIPNGFDIDVEIGDIHFVPKDKITIGYVGSFYYSSESRKEIMQPWWKKRGHRKLQYVPRKEDWLYRTPYFFFKSLQNLFDQNPILKDKIVVKFAGNKNDWFDEMVEEFNLKDNIEHLGWVSHKESLKFQQSCDFLLLTSSKVLEGKDYSIAGKTFEYFTIQKPILAFVAEGAQKDVLELSQLAYLFSPDDVEKSSEMLKKVFTKPSKLQPNKEYINSFKVKYLTERFAKVISGVIED
ncbi:glycosyltransferase family 4 protein [Echinicola sediminis]